MFLEVAQRSSAFDQVGYLNGLGVVAKEYVGTIGKENSTGGNKVGGIGRCCITGYRGFRLLDC